MDIVERLRRDADRMGSTDRIDMAHEAADEIERLRAELSTIVRRMARKRRRTADWQDRYRRRIAKLSHNCQHETAYVARMRADLDAERALSDRLAAEVAHFIDGGTPDVHSVGAFNDWKEARK